ncbi:MAG: GyrI-like domain-containing protein [Bacteroidota bacterium]|nr:GyrI-like domain-containing protein [Bacteroidota bacterium]
MKKWLTGFCILLFLSIAAVYIFFPSDLTVANVEGIQCNVNSANKFIGDERQWGNWWPGDSGRGQPAGALADGRSPGFEYGGMRYRMPGRYRHLMEVQIVTPDSTIHSRITIVGSADTRDSTSLEWAFHLNAGWDPIGRIHQYREARKLKADLAEILSALRAFLDDKEKVYGIRIREVSTTDSFLIAIRSIYPSRPGTGDLSALIHKLKSIIAAGSVRETGNPMVNITPAGQGKFEAMVAIPTNRELKGDKNVISSKLVRGKYLMTEVRGGDYTVNKALEQLQEYMYDYQRTTMAIPFQSWVTDRSVEHDTAKWVTKVYCPVY